MWYNIHVFIFVSMARITCIIVIHNLQQFENVLHKSRRQTYNRSKQVQSTTAQEMRREEKNPDSLIISLNFEGCRVKETLKTLRKAAKDKKCYLFGASCEFGVCYTLNHSFLCAKNIIYLTTNRQPSSTKK